MGKPKPFQRKSVTISSDITGARKEWRDVDPSEISEGDLIMGEGLVVDVTSERPDFTSERPDVVTFEMKSGILLSYFRGAEPVRAFVKVGRG